MSDGNADWDLVDTIHFVNHTELLPNTSDAAATPAAGLAVGFAAVALISAAGMFVLERKRR